VYIHKMSNIFNNYFCKLSDYKWNQMPLDLDIRL